MIYDLCFIFLGCKDIQNQWGGERNGNKNPPYFLLKENTEDKNIRLISFSTSLCLRQGSLPNQ